MKKRPFQKKERRERTTFIHKIKGILYWLQSLSITKHILFFYLFITLIGSLILLLPISQKGHTTIPYIDTLFLSASAFSDTGLSTVIIGSDFTYFGQAIVATLILVGGTGWIALKIYLFNIIFNIPISLQTRAALAQERGSSHIGSTRNLIKVSVTAMIVISLIATIILSFYFYFVPGNFNEFSTWLDPKNNSTFRNGEWGFVDTHGTFITNESFNPLGDWNTSIRYGLFHAISSVNNAGFDIMGGHSIAPYYDNYTIQIIFMSLFVIGGMGFPLIYDVYQWSHTKFTTLSTSNSFKFSLFTKLSSITYFFIAIVGIGTTFLVEIKSEPGNGISIWNGKGFGSQSDRIMAIFFNTMSTRNAGFATVNYQAFNGITLVIHSALMFIGSAPSSTGGGIRTTTMAIVFLTLWTHISNRSSVRIFRRQINPAIVLRSLVVFATAIMLIIVGTIILVTSLESNGGRIPIGNGGSDIGTYSINDIIFQVCSAFGTTGLSTGLTHYLNTLSKLTLIVIMFIGQLGVSSTLLVWGNKRTKSRHYSYYSENITIG